MDEVRAQWAKRVADWRRSGLTAKRFADSIGVKVATLSYWAYRGLVRGHREKRRTRQAHVVGAQSAASRVDSALVEIVAGSRDECFELTLRDGRRLQIPGSFSVVALERLLCVLEAPR